MKIAIIGGGNLGASIASGLLESRFVNARDITVTRRNTAALSALENKEINVTADNQKAIQHADAVFICVKPFQIKEVLEQVVFGEGQIMISVVTGVWIKDLQQWTGGGVKIFRAMPNTAIAIRQSVTCISHEEEGPEAIGQVQTLFNQLGSTIFIDEKLMDAATVLGACGIAFAMRYIRASIQGGIQIGFSAQQATQIAARTVNGAAALLLQNQTHPEYEIDKVTTPRGCTIAGLNELEHQGFSSAVIKGLNASYEQII